MYSRPTHRVAHSAENMFALVARIEDYPKFLPLCEALAIKCREQSGSREVLVATMTVGYRMIRESFTTRVALDSAACTILVEYLDGPFTISKTAGVSSRPPKGERGGVLYRLCFRSRLFERLVGGLFARAVHHYTEAFEARADAVYGR